MVNTVNAVSKNKYSLCLGVSNASCHTLSVHVYE